MLDRRSALKGVVSFIALAPALAACTNADGTKMTTRQLLQKAVSLAQTAVSFGKVLLAGFDANCAQKPDSSICTNAVIVAAVAIGRPALTVLSDALQVASAALANNTSTEDALGTALGRLLAAQDDVQKLIDALGDKKTAERMRDEMDVIRRDARRLGYDTAA